MDFPTCVLLSSDDSGFCEAKMFFVMHNEHVSDHFPAFNLILWLNIIYDDRHPGLHVPTQQCALNELTLKEETPRVKGHLNSAKLQISSQASNIVSV